MENPYVLLGIRKTKDKKGGLFLIHNFIYLYEKKVEQKKKKRFFRIEKNKFRKESTLIKLDNLYPEYSFARTKFNDIHIIFEVSSGYIVGQGKTYTNARNAAKKYLIFTSGKFSIIVDAYQLNGKE